MTLDRGGWMTKAFPHTHLGGRLFGGREGKVLLSALLKEDISANVLSRYRGAGCNALPRHGHDVDANLDRQWYEERPSLSSEPIAAWCEMWQALPAAANVCMHLRVLRARRRHLALVCRCGGPRT